MTSHAIASPSQPLTSGSEGKWLATMLSLGVAMSYVAAALAAANMPPEQQADPNVSAHAFWMALSAAPLPHLAMHWAFASAGIFGVGLVAMVWYLRTVEQGPWLALTSALALVGFAVLARSHLMEVEFDLKVLPHYQTSDPAFQAAVQVVAGLALDVPDGILSLGAIAPWMIVVSLGRRSSGARSGFIAFVGLLAALSFFVGVFGYVSTTQLPIVVSFVSGYLIFGPLWHLILASQFHRVGAYTSA